MVMTTKERSKLRNELVGQGYSWEYVDEWQPKTTLYLHRAKTDQNGNEVTAVGTKISGVPGNPDYVARKAKIGMLPSPPGESCTCKWCSIRNARADVKPEPDEVEVKGESVLCQDCGESVSALTKAGALSKMRVHIKKHQDKA